MTEATKIGEELSPITNDLDIDPFGSTFDALHDSSAGNRRFRLGGAPPKRDLDSLADEEPPEKRYTGSDSWR